MKELKMYERYSSMSEFLKTDTNWRSPDYLARELYEINTYKLKDTLLRGRHDNINWGYDSNK